MTNNIFVFTLLCLQIPCVLCICSVGSFYEKSRCRPCGEPCDKFFRQTIEYCTHKHDVHCGQCQPGYEDKGLPHCDKISASESSVKYPLVSVSPNYHVSTASNLIKSVDTGIFLSYFDLQISDPCN